MSYNDFIDTTDLNNDELFEILHLAQNIMKNPSEYKTKCEGKLLCELFYEPSTRTALSFQAAMLRLGGNTFGFTDASSSSAAKGESLSDTIRVVSNYSDILVIRHPNEGAAMAAAHYSTVPVVNAGDGGHLHPTQTLADLLLIYNEKGRIDNLKIGISGDLKNGRTVHSLVKALCMFNNEFIFISAKELAMPRETKEFLLEHNSTYVEVDSIEAAISNLDILYCTRVQKERFSSEAEYNRLKDVFIIDSEKLSKAKTDMIVMHPLPRLNEISTSVDRDKRAKYFEQTNCGMYVRMALIIKLLSRKAENLPKANIISNQKCTNQSCITNFELELPKFCRLKNNLDYCYFCEKIKND